MEAAAAALLWLLFWVGVAIVGLAVLAFVAVIVVGVATGIRDGVAEARRNRADRR